MRICERALHHVQVIDAEGTVRICSWEYDGGIIGKLSQNSLEEIYHSEAAKLIRKMHFNQDFSNCNPNACPFVANNTVDEHSIDVQEVPRLPSELYLAYENVCNYHCVTCTIPGCMERNKSIDLESKYCHIDNELKKVLPHIKILGANGQGEFFVSRHIMKLMQEWEPLADPKECTASIETNGSLFNESNWQKISNLARFNLDVSITVMSFEEESYQKLSGTHLPVSNIIDNLRFVKSLREQGIIKRLELATVYQLGNFRHLPEFARRCVEEFGADYVRLRPYEPWVDPGLDEWMRDVRNADNPYHQEYLEVMKAPIFKHPKVHDWGGGLESGLGKAIYPKTLMDFRNMEAMLRDDDFAEKVKNYLDSDRVTVYGLTTAGRLLVSLLDEKMNIPYIMDRNQAGNTYRNKPIVWIDGSREKDMPVIITLRSVTAVAVEKLLRQAGYDKKIVNLKDILSL